MPHYRYNICVVIATNASISVTFSQLPPFVTMRSDTHRGQADKMLSVASSDCNLEFIWYTFPWYKSLHTHCNIENLQDKSSQIMGEFS